MASYASSLQHAYHKEVPTTGDEAEDPILEATDKALATFSSKRQLMLDLGKRRIFRAHMESEMRGHNRARRSRVCDLGNNPG